jgi:hypothetical protein
LNLILTVAVFEKIPAEISSEIKGAISALHGEGLSRRKIVEALFDQGRVVSLSTVNQLIIRRKKKDSGVQRLLRRLGTQCLSSKRTGDLIKEVDRATKTANPRTQYSLAHRYQVSQRTLQLILKDNLGVISRNKMKTRALSNKQAAQRLERGPRFLELINGNKWKYVSSIDEAWLSLNDVDSVRDVHYQKEDRRPLKVTARSGNPNMKKRSCLPRESAPTEKQAFNSYHQRRKLIVGSSSTKF